MTPTRESLIFAGSSKNKLYLACGQERQQSRCPTHNLLGNTTTLPIKLRVARSILGNVVRERKKNHFPETRPRRHGGTRSERVRLLCAVAGAGVWAIGSKWGWGDGDAGRDEGSVGTTPTA